VDKTKCESLAFKLVRKVGEEYVGFSADELTKIARYGKTSHNLYFNQKAPMDLNTFYV